MSYTRKIVDVVKLWVGKNVHNWLGERHHLSWFKIEMIPDDFLPESIFSLIGGAQRRRSSVMEMASNRPSINSNRCYNNINLSHGSDVFKKQGTLLEISTSARMHERRKDVWRELAEAIYSTRSNNFKSNYVRRTSEA